MANCDLPTPHNNFFTFALSQTEVARGLLRHHLNSEMLKLLRLDTLALESGDFIDPDLREKFSDLLFSVELNAGESERRQKAFVCFLFEHKSEQSDETVAQVLGYVVRLWERRLRDRLPLGPIIPIVVYHGEVAWTSITRFEQLVPFPVEFSEIQVRFGFSVLDLSQVSIEEIASNPLLQVTWSLLKYGRSPDLIAYLRSILQLLANAIDGPLVGQWLQAIGVYVMAVNKEIDQDKLSSIVRQVFPTQIEPDSLADRLLREGREEGREEGCAVGKIYGKIQIIQELLGDDVSVDEQLEPLNEEELSKMLEDLRSRLRARNV